jgi:hypothetical protein
MDYNGTLAWHPDQSPFELVVSVASVPSDAACEVTITILDYKPALPEIVHSDTSKRYHDPQNAVWTIACEFKSVGETDQQISNGRRM